MHYFCKFLPVVCLHSCEVVYLKDMECVIVCCFVHFNLLGDIFCCFLIKVIGKWVSMSVELCVIVGMAYFVLEGCILQSDC